jgi:hypothetical protein
VLLQVNAKPNTLSGTGFTFVVPGHQLWTVRTVVAVASTHVGGAPNRAFQLVVTRPPNTVIAAAADDAGTEPATVTVTWANVPASSIGAGNIGISVGAVAIPTLEPGYVITGTILNPAASDAWTAATAWYTFADS